MLTFDEHNNVLKTEFEGASDSVFCFVLGYDHVYVCFVLIRILVGALVSVVGWVVAWFIHIWNWTSCGSATSKSFCLKTILFDLSVVSSWITFLFKVKTIFWVVSISFLCFNDWSRFSFSYLTCQNRCLRLILHSWLLFCIKIKIITHFTIEQFTLRLSLSFLFLKISVLQLIFLICWKLSLLTNLVLRWEVLWLESR